MRKTTIVLTLLILGSIGVMSIFNPRTLSVTKNPASSPQTINKGQKPLPQGTIDGTKHPELVPDHAAYSMLFRFIAQNRGENLKPRLHGYFKSYGFTDSDEDALIAATDEFTRRVGVLDLQAKEIKDQNWPNPTAEVMAQLTQLQQQKETIVEEIVASLLPRMGVSGSMRFKQHINERIKRKMKMFPPIPLAGGAGGQNPHADHH